MVSRDVDSRAVGHVLRQLRLRRNVADRFPPPLAEARMVELFLSGYCYDAYGKRFDWPRISTLPEETQPPAGPKRRVR